MFQIDLYTESHRYRAGLSAAMVRDYIPSRDECGGLYPNLLEYIRGGRRCPLMLDVEWVTPKGTPHGEMLAGASALVDALVAFVAIALRHGSARITKDDVCISDACKTDGSKASFHIKIHRLVFACPETDMRAFAFYFSSWLFEEAFDAAEKRFDIPDIFFLQTTDTQRDIAACNSKENYDVFMQSLRAKAEGQWGECRFMHCGIDSAIYSSGRAFRCEGSTKANKPGEMPRFLRPCLITDWWRTRVPAASLADDVLADPEPDKQHRQAWALAAMLLPADSSCVSIHVSLPDGMVLQGHSYDNNDDDDDTWRWILDTSPYPWPRKPISHGVRRRRGARPAISIADVGAPSLVLVERGRPNAVVKEFQKRDGRWYSVSDNDWCDAEQSEHIEKEKCNALYHVLDPQTRHYHALLDRRLMALQHMEQSGVLRDDDGVPIAYAAMRTRLEESKRYDGQAVCISALDDRAMRLMFMEPDVVLDPCLPAH